MLSSSAGAEDRAERDHVATVRRGRGTVARLWFQRAEADDAAGWIAAETLAVRRSAEQEWETDTDAAHHRLAGTFLDRPDGEVNGAWIATHRQFHRALLAICASPSLEGIAAESRESAELNRIWSRSIAHDGDRDIACEHRRLTELTLARDVEGTAEALAPHIQRINDAFLPNVAGTA